MPLTTPLLLAASALTRSVARRTGRGLYAGKTILSGNRVSEDGGNRSRRTWKPNVHPASLFSEALGRPIRIRATAAALRNVDKAGGLDRYLLGSSEAELGGGVGEGLRLAVMAARADAQAEAAAEAKAAAQRAAAAAKAAAADAEAAEAVPPTPEGQ